MSDAIIIITIVTIITIHSWHHHHHHYHNHHHFCDSAEEGGEGIVLADSGCPAPNESKLLQARSLGLKRKVSLFAKKEKRDFD